MELHHQATVNACVEDLLKYEVISEQLLRDYLEKMQLTKPRYRLPPLEQLKEKLEGDEELLDGVADLVPGDEYRVLVDPVERAYNELLREA
jgi:hypothetical protein